VNRHQLPFLPPNQQHQSTEDLKHNVNTNVETCKKVRDVAEFNLPCDNATGYFKMHPLSAGKHCNEQHNTFLSIFSHSVNSTLR